MHNMLEQFYRYIAKKTVEYFTSIELKPGARFDIRFQNENQVRNLTEELKKLVQHEEFEYQSSYKTFCIPCGDVKVIVASTLNAVTGDFLTRLRNQVGTEETLFRDKAILFIHDSTLDSIVKGSESMQREGMPLHHKTIENEILNKLKSDELTQISKKVLQFIVNKKQKELFEDRTALFEYKEVIEAIESSRVGAEQYKGFGLFYDSQLEYLDDKEAQQRLEQNLSLFSTVSAAHQYGIPEQELDKEFDKRGIDLLSTKNWYRIDFQEVKESTDRKKDKTPLYYIEDLKKLTLEGCTYWERPDGDGAKGQRIRNILVFVKEGLSQVQLEFAFDQHLRKQNIDIVKGSLCDTDVSGKKLYITIPHHSGECEYSRVKYKGSREFEFRILTIECEECILQGIQTQYSLPVKIKEKAVLVKTDESNLVLNPQGSIMQSVRLTDKENHIDISDTQERIIVEKDIGTTDEDGSVYIEIKWNGKIIPIRYIEESIKPKRITGLKIWKLKRERMAHFQYTLIEEVKRLKLFQQTQQYFVQEDLNELLLIEKAMIDSGYIYFKQPNKEEITPYELSVPAEIQQSYLELIEYYRRHNTLPSLAYMDEELLYLMKNYANSVLQDLHQIPVGESLSIQYKNILKMATVERDYGEKEILWSPLHPLNAIYQVIVNEYLDDEEVEETILQKLRPTYLVPYLYQYDQQLYVPVEQNTALEWLFYVEEGLPSYQGLHRYVGNIVHQTIEKFIEHFSYYFTASMEAVLKINLIRMGEGRDVLQGLFSFFSAQLKKKNPEELYHMEVRIYSEDKAGTAFDELLYSTNELEWVEQKYQIQYDKDLYTLVDYINLFRKKVHFYQLPIKNQTFEYAHLSFAQVNHKIEQSYRNMYDVRAGIGLNGLMAGLPSISTDSVYLTGFGLQGMDSKLSPFLQLVKGLNAIARINMSSSPYNPDEAIVTAIPVNENEEYDALDQSSHWVTYIAPKVDMHFFLKTHAPGEIILHYTDQLTSPVSLDAVTVSTQTHYYKKQMSEYLQRIGVQYDDEVLADLFGFCNVISGEWLTQMLSTKKEFTTDTLRNISIVHLGYGFVEYEDWIWIPISIGEILRIIDGMGIRANSGLFKEKNHEAYIDSLLFVGVHRSAEQVKVACYPIHIVTETGNKKKKETVLESLMENIEGSSFENRFYRYILMQIVISTMEKWRISNLIEEEEAQAVLDTPIREKLLNDEFGFSEEHIQRIGKEAVITVVEGKEEISSKRIQDRIYIRIGEVNAWGRMLLLVEPIEEIEQIDIEIPEVIIDKSPTPDEDININKEKDKPSSPQQEEPFSHLPAAQYSVLIYQEEVEQDIFEKIQYYLSQGNKVYFVTASKKEEVINGIGAQNYELLIQYQKQYLISLSFEILIEVEESNEFYIIDGQIEASMFYEVLKSSSFNFQQYDIEHADLDKHLIVKAGAGTGKTKVMIDRIMYIKHMNPSLEFSQIAMLTFTNEATMQMRERLSQRLSSYYGVTKDHKYLQWIDELSYIRVNTIHAFAMDMMSALDTEIGMVSPKIRSFRYEKQKILEQAIDQYRVEYPEKYKVFQQIPQYILVRNILKMNEFLDNRAVILDEGYEDQQIDFGSDSTEMNHFLQYLLKKLQNELNALKARKDEFEINDLIKKLREIQQIDGIHHKIDLRYLMVDEFQDTDDVQVNFIVWLVKQLQCSLFVVGDVKQSIYRFRGADYTAFEQLQHGMGGICVDKQLIKNYRSEKQLLQDINHLFSQIKEEVLTFNFEKEDQLEATFEGDPPGGIHFENLSTFLGKIEHIQKIYREKKKSEETMAVLVRTNEEVREIVKELEEKKVPCIAEIKGDFYRHIAVREFYLLIRALLFADKSLEYYMLTHSSYGKEPMSHFEMLNNYSSDRNVLRGLMQKHSGYEEFRTYVNRLKVEPVLKIVKEIITKYNPHIRYANRYYNSLLEDPQQSKEELQKITKFKTVDYQIQLNHLLYLIQKEFSDTSMTISDLESFLKIQMVSNTLENVKKVPEEYDANVLRCMTVHKAKGLEFDYVVLPYTNQEFLQKRKLNLLLKDSEQKCCVGYRMSLEQGTYTNDWYQELYNNEKEEIVGEETRLFYVAVTRAIKELYIIKDKNANKNTRINSWQDLAMRW